MTFREYQLKAKETATYPEKDHNFIYAAFGMMGEAGEVAEANILKTHSRLERNVIHGSGDNR